MTAVAAPAPAALREKHDGALSRHHSVRVWLRLLSCAMVVEKRLRRGLSDRFDATLPRFDILAALDASPGGLQLSQLSQRLLVSNGNVTGLVQQLEAQGLVATRPVPEDRRARVVSLTPAGRTAFSAMAAAHHEWIERMFADLSPHDHRTLHDVLGRLKASLATNPGISE